MHYIAHNLAVFGVTGLTFSMVLMLIGEFLWLVTYLLVIRVGFAQRTYGVPLAAICLNITWEAFFAVHCPLGSRAGLPEMSQLCPDSQGLGLALDVTWFVLDVVILYQLLRFGRNQQSIPEIGRHFYLVIVLTLALTYLGQLAFMLFYRDVDGDVMAWISNLLMSVLFVLMRFLRPDLRGLSYGAAWTKLLGSGLNALGLLLTAPFPFERHPSYLLLYFLFGSVFAFDSAYVWLLQRREPWVGSPAS